MPMIDSPLMRGLERVLDLSSFRQQVIAGNLANVDTPAYRTRDVRQFPGELQRAMAGEEEAVFTPVARQVPGLLERPDLNNVSVERESLLMAQNELRYQVAIQFLRDQFHTIAAAINGGGGGQ
jgi:flagellar basal-body rod protein FlgB